MGFLFILSILCIHVDLVCLEDVLVGRDQESGGAAGGVEHGLVLLRVHHLDDEINDVARSAELAGIALGAEY